MSQVGVVAIGRNEGERLKQCLASVTAYPLVYVDSGSTDRSVEYATSVGAHCVDLDMSKPFSAARARNEGMRVLRSRFPAIKYVMFVDGDCEVVPGFVSAAIERLEEDSSLAVVCGRRRERFPNASIFNRLCDIEWNTPVGDASSCGGDAVYRADVFVDLKGFDDTFIAGEEPELCFRIREAGYRIERIDREMTLHDAAMYRFGQWWKRAQRSGYAYYLNFSKHGHKQPEYFKKRDLRSIFVWAGFVLLIPIAVVAKSWVISLALIFVLSLQAMKIARLQQASKGLEYKHALIYAVFTLLGKIPQLWGIARAYLKSSSGKSHTLVEYK